MDDSLFIRELGIRSPMLKVLDFLMDNESFDYSKTDIAKGSGLSRTTLFKVWPWLEALELITATRTCLLYTSDAADDLLCVDLGGGRIITNRTYQQTYAYSTLLTIRKPTFPLNSR